MKVNKKCLLELAASKDKTRYAIAEPFLDIKDGKGQLIATDGRVMAVVPCHIDATDEQGYVSGDVLRMARKLTKKSETANVSCNGVAVMDGAQMPREGVAKDGNFPNWRQVFPNAAANGYKATVGIDVKLLWQLAQAMGTEGVILSIKDATSPILVSPSGNGKSKPASAEARGVIMPVRIS